MPCYERGNVRIHYEEAGSGFPLLLIPGGGLNSNISFLTGFAAFNAQGFGCGVGRLTRALADHFERVVGIDVAPSMIAQARAMNREYARCNFRVNRSVRLRLALRSSTPNSRAHG